jgi:hypothetical protein
MPTFYPTSITSPTPKSIPTSYSTSVPSSKPTSIPTSDPTSVPSSTPTSIPTSYSTTSYPTWFHLQHQHLFQLLIQQVRSIFKTNIYSNF